MIIDTLDCYFTIFLVYRSADLLVCWSAGLEGVTLEVSVMS